MSRKLTKDLIRSRLGNDNLETIKNLNLWGNNISDISLLSGMPLLEIISLSMNHIKDLSVFTNLKNVKELYLKDNQISDFKQIEYLKNCQKLEILCLIDNPISNLPNYHQKIFEILPHLKKLDDVDNNNNPDINKSSAPPNMSVPQSSFILFKKIFPKKSNKFITKGGGINTSINESNNKQNEIKNSNSDKNSNILNKSFQKKKTLGTFRKLGNKKENINLDLSVDYAKENILAKNNEIFDNNRSTFVGNYKSKVASMNTSKSKYNKKVVGNFKKDQIKNYQSTLLTYQEFDAPVKKEKNKKNLNDNNQNIKKIIDNNEKIIKSNKNEKVVLESIRILLETLNLSELKCVNEDIQKIMKDKNK